MIDLGANVGRYTGEYAKVVGPRGCVLAVEPDPLTAAKLRDAVGGYPQVDIAECAAFSHSEGLVFFRDGRDPKRDSCWADNRIEGGESFPVATSTLDALAARVPALTAIKVDVQGAECHVLDGACETLKRDLVWAIELWPAGLRNAGRSVEELAAMFAMYGFQPIEKWSSWDEVIPTIVMWDGHKSTDVILRKCSPETT